MFDVSLTLFDSISLLLLTEFLLDVGCDQYLRVLIPQCDKIRCDC